MKTSGSGSRAVIVATTLVAFVAAPLSAQQSPLPGAASGPGVTNGSYPGAPSFGGTPSVPGGGAPLGQWMQPPSPPRQLGPTGVSPCHQRVAPQQQVVSVPAPRDGQPGGGAGVPVSQVSATPGSRGALQAPGTTPTDPRRAGGTTPPAQPQQPAQSPQPAQGRESEDLSRIEAGFYQDSYQSLAGLRRPQNALQGAGPQGSSVEPLRQYGYTTFAADVSTFAPVDDIPVGPDYVLGPGDDLTIHVWGPVDATVVRTVDRNGRIVLPKVGDLRVWGLTFSQADRLIREQLSRYFRGFQTSVTMGRLRTLRVHVVGEVCQPGVYTLSSLATLTNALFSAGGPTKLGSLREVRLLRNGHQVGTLDLYDFLQRGDRTRDFRLESGDTVFVPTVGGVAAIAGEVKRPAIYELRGQARVSDLVTLAGGITPSSYLKRVQLVRAQPNAERVTVDVDLSQYYLKGDRASNPPVNGGDLVLIYRSDPRIYNTIKVEGAVKYPGTYELKPMMRITQLLPADKLLPEAQPERVEIARRRPDLAVEIIPVNLRKAWSGDQDQDVLLKALDEVAVRTELKAASHVTLSGQVVRPGRYVIAEGERLSSVLDRAGGFTDRAYLRSAVFTREALQRVEKERLDEFVRVQEQRILAAASTTVVGADKDENASQQKALEAQREALRALAAKVAVGRMVVRLDAPEKLRGGPDDIVLVGGDSLEVTEPPASVYVLGAVRTSTSVLWVQGASPEYYLNRVGGLTKEADKKELHIVKADGSAMSSFTKLRDIEPGDTIVVPPKQEEKIRVLPTVRDVVQTVGAALLSFAALAVLF
ncbi:MAG: SLBB domain-containing protein [Candidatus Rokubacteria bacterium]|nr:SLBB domain-containing protein [Candidatus Rokubacteria bacterium]